MTLPATAALFVMMLGLAAVPSASVALVVARSATLGVANGAAVAAGIVLGDLLFVTLALVGMTALAQTMGSLFVILRYAAAAYLIWMGFRLLRSKPTLEPLATRIRDRKGSLATSLASGFLLTLGDVKAILFYASLFPAFIDLTRVGIGDILIIAAVTITAVGGVKLAYAFAARRLAIRLRGRKAGAVVTKGAGTLMVGTGTFLLVKS